MAHWGEVPNEPLREAVLEAVSSGRETYSSLCRRMGWTFPHPRYPSSEKADHARLKRSLGLAPCRSGKGAVTVVRGVRYETALAFAEALNLDPVDLGL
jgi:hypothetical protein